MYRLYGIVLRKLILSALLASTCTCMPVQITPHIFFSDLESGPNSGGRDNKGSWVTIWGNGFGAVRGESVVTVGGGAVANYPLWSDRRITFQLGPGAKTGEVVVHVARERASNGVPFRVRTGRIFFVATTGSDRHSGSYMSPWRTIVQAKNSMSPGDIAYIEDGVAQNVQDHFDAYLSMDRNGSSNSGTANLPKALVAYPHATATIGIPQGLRYGVRTPNIPAQEDYWVFSQLHIVGGIQAMDIGGIGWRIVGNRFECPGADGQVGCFQVSGGSRIRFYGNEVTNAGRAPATSKFYHAVYFSTDSNHIDVGWNHIHDNYSCRAIQFHSSPQCTPSCGEKDSTGFDQYDLHVHDNLIHGDNCNGINFATIDPSRGGVEAYNNVIYHVGLRDPSDMGGSFSCIYVAGITYHGRRGAGTVEAFNNTLYDCGQNSSRNAQGSRGAFGIGESALTLHLRNNIVMELPGEIYLDGTINQITGDKNLWFGAGRGPRQTTSNSDADPLFVNLNALDFHLADASPARDKGETIAANNPFSTERENRLTDKDGLARPQGTAFCLGAYEVPGSPASPKRVSNVTGH